MIVYCITNKTNGKQYIGMTQRTLEQRWNSHCSSARNGSPFRFHSAIRKYGEDGFDKEVLYENLEIDECRLIEEQTIESYDTLNSGYNATPGGCGGWVVKSEKYDEWLKNMTTSVQGEKNGKYSGYTDDELLNMAREYVLEKGYIKTVELYKVYEGYPKSFSKFRFSQYEDKNGLKRFRMAYKDKFGEEYPKYIITEEHKKRLAEANLGKKYKTINGVRVWE